MYAKIYIKIYTKKCFGYCEVKVRYGLCMASVELGQAEVCFRYGSEQFYVQSLSKIKKKK